MDGINFWCGLNKFAKCDNKIVKIVKIDKKKYLEPSWRKGIEETRSKSVNVNEVDVGVVCFIYFIFFVVTLFPSHLSFTYGSWTLHLCEARTLCCSLTFLTHVHCKLGAAISERWREKESGRGWDWIQDSEKGEAHT